MDKLKLFLIYTVSFLLQCTVLNTIAVFGITPNILLVLTIVYSFFFQKMDGIVFSILFGLIQDMFFGQVVGISPLIYFAVGMLLKMVRSVVFRDNKLLLILVTAAATLFYTAAYWALNSMMLQADMSLIYWLKSVPVSIVWNYIVLAPAATGCKEETRFYDMIIQGA